MLAAGAMSDESHFDWRDVRVAVHPSEVVVLRGTRSDLAAHCLTFLSAAFFDPRSSGSGGDTADVSDGSPGRLFSLSRVHEDVTLVCDAATLSRLPAGTTLGLARDPGRWGVLQVWEGDAAVGVTGVVAAVTGGLGDVDVLLYVSTVNTDILVVPYDRVGDARERCEAALARMREKPAQRGSADGSEARAGSSTRGSALSDRDYDQIPVMLSAEDGAVCLGRIPSGQACLAMHFLCGSMLGVAGSDGSRDGEAAPVFSFVESPLDGTTVVMAGSAVGCTPAAARLEMWPAREKPAEWSVIRLSQGSGGQSTEGVMRPLVAAMADAGVSIYYLSTMSDDFMLVPRDRLNEAIQALRDSDEIYVEYCDVEGSHAADC